MHRYRINYPLLFGLAAFCAIIGGISLFAIHPWQMNRNAEWFLERANAAIAEEDVRTAFDYQSKYVRYRKDETDARVTLANLAIDILNLDDVSAIERGQALGILQDSVRKTNDADLRRKYAEMLVSGGRPGEAIDHIDELLANDPGNSKLQALRVRALFATKDFRRASEHAYKLLGYDKESSTFDPEKAVATDQPEIFYLLADTLAKVDNKPIQAQQIIDRMVEVNPESYEAHLKQAIFLQGIGEKETASAALAKAYELNPTDADILVLKGQFALLEKDFDKAYQYLSEGLKNHPHNFVFFKLLSITETQRGNNAEALTILDRGIKEFESQKPYPLVLDKISLLLRDKKIEDAEKEIEVLEKMNLALLEPMVAFQRARIKWYNQQWANSASEFERIRPLLFRFPDTQLLAGVLLGSAYESLGQFDLATQAYNRVLQSNPDDPRALAGLKQVNKRTRNTDYSDPQSFNVSLLARRMLALPVDKQDWRLLDSQILKFVEANKLPKIYELLYQAQIFLEREMYNQARNKIREADKVDPESLNVHLSATKLMWLEPQTSLEDALINLDRTETKYGVSLKTRVLRAEMLAATGDDDVNEQLHALTAGLEEWNEQEKVRFYTILGRHFLQLGKIDEALKIWEQAAQIAPNNLPVRMQLFDVALQKRDEQAMLDAQSKILELVHSKQDASYILTEVKRRIILYGNDESKREQLLEARAMLDAAMLQRPEWNELHVIYGHLLLVLQEDINLALERLNDALKFGPPNMKVVALQIRLLAKQGLFQEAREQMKLMPVEIHNSSLGQVNAEVLLQTGDPAAAFIAAKGISEQNPDSVATQKWFAAIAAKTGESEAAAKAWQAAIELYPTEPDSWSQLMILYAQQGNKEKLQQVLREAHLALDAEFIPLLTAKTYELQGRWQNAENLYLSVYGERINEIPIAKRMAEFYLLWLPANPDNAAKANSFLNRILRAFYEGNVEPRHMPIVAWARRKAALMLAATGDYRKGQQAQKLLMLGAVDGKLPHEDKVMQGELLAALKDPASQAQALQVLNEIKKDKLLDKKGAILLAKVMHNTGNWDGSEDLMLDTLVQYKADNEARATYSSLLIEHGKYEQARRRLNPLKNSADQKVYLQLLARLAAKKGDTEAAHQALTQMLPENLNGSLDPTQLATVRSIAHLAADYEDTELAEKLFSLYVNRVPAAGFELTRYHALYGNTDTAVERMQKSPPHLTDATLSLATQMLRKRRLEFGDKYDEAIQQLISKALRDDPDSAHRMVTQAEVLEIQQKDEECIAAYDKLLSRSDVPDRERAAASNNLAFILALREERLDEAEKLVNEAISFYGPMSSLLDTRGLVRVAKQQYELAIEDLKLAVTVDRQPLTIFHLARALLLAGEEEEAQKRWQEAQKVGLKKEIVPPLEQEAYEELAGKIQQL